MHSLRHYITESVKFYNYNIKIAGDIDKNFLDMFRHNLKKFDPVEMSDPVRTPVQKSPYGFPELENEPVTIFKAIFRYPATEAMIQQTAQLLGYNLNKVRAINPDYDESVDKEVDQYANQAKDSPVLQKTDMGSAEGAKEANKAYGDSYLKFIKDQHKDPAYEIPYEGKKTATSHDPFKAMPEDSKGTKSPMSKINRPPKPKTGATA